LVCSKEKGEIGRVVVEAGTKDKKHHFLPGENGVFLIIEEN
jgi:hypothetical protein